MLINEKISTPDEIIYEKWQKRIIEKAIYKLKLKLTEEEYKSLNNDRKEEIIKIAGEIIDKNFIQWSEGWENTLAYTNKDPEIEERNLSENLYKKLSEELKNII